MSIADTTTTTSPSLTRRLKEGLYYVAKEALSNEKDCFCAIADLSELSLNVYFCYDFNLFSFFMFHYAAVDVDVVMLKTR